MNTRSGQNYFELLPEDVLTYVFYFLDRKAIYNAFLVNHHFCNLVLEYCISSHYENLFKTHFPDFYYPEHRQFYPHIFVKIDDHTISWYSSYENATSFYQENISPHMNFSPEIIASIFNWIKTKNVEKVKNFIIENLTDYASFEQCIFYILDPFYFNVAHWIYKTNQPELLEFLYEYSCKLFNSDSASHRLINQIKFNQIASSDVIEQIIREKNTDSHFLPILEMACNYGNMIVVEKWLAQLEEELKENNHLLTQLAKYLKDAVISSVRFNQIAIFNLLLKNEVLKQFFRDHRDEVLKDVHHSATLINRWEFLTLLNKEFGYFNRDDFSFALLNHRHFVVINYFLEQDKDLINLKFQVTFPDGQQEVTPIFYAVKTDNFKLIQFLMDKGADPTIACGSLNSFMLACKQNNQNISYLIDHANEKVLNTMLRHAAGLESFQIFSLILNLLRRITGAPSNKAVLVQNRNIQGLTPLHYAVRNNKLKMVDYLIDQGIDVNVKCDNGKAPIFYAIAARNYLMTEFLIKKGGLCNGLIDMVSSSSQTTWLCEAVKQDDFSTVEFLLKNCANINNTNSINSTTALHIAANSNHFEMFKLLMNKDANIAIRDGSNATPLSYAIFKMNFDIVAWLIENDKLLDIHIYEMIVDIIQFQNHFALVALQNNRVDLVKFLISHGLNPNLADSNGTTFLHVAMQPQFDVNLVEFLIMNGANVDAKDNNGQTPLHFVITSNSTDSWAKINFLIQNGANVNEKSEQDNSSLHFLAATTIDFENHSSQPLSREIFSETLLMRIELLQSKGASFNETNDSGQTPLALCANNPNRLNRNAMIEALKRKGPTFCRKLVEDSKARHAEMLIQASYYVLDFLLTYGADINSVNSEGQTRLHFEVCKDKKNNFIKFLIDKNANLTIQDMNGNTPLHLAVEKNVPVANLKYLLNVNPELLNIKNHDGNTPLHVCVADSSCKTTIRTLIPYHPDLCATNNKGNTPLHEYMISYMQLIKKKYNKDILTLLLGKDCSPLLVKNNDGNSPLHLIATTQKCGAKLISYILNICMESKAEIGNILHQTDHEGNTLIHLATLARNEDLVKILLFYGSDISRKNNYGNSALNIASSDHHCHMIAQIMKNKDTEQKRSTKRVDQLHPDLSLSTVNQLHVEQPSSPPVSNLFSLFRPELQLPSAIENQTHKRSRSENTKESARKRRKQ